MNKLEHLHYYDQQTKHKAHVKKYKNSSFGIIQQDLPSGMRAHRLSPQLVCVKVEFV